MNTVSRQAPVAPIVSFSKVVNRPHTGIGDERLSIVIRSTEHAVEVGLLNHYVLNTSGSLNLAVVGLRLPADADGQAFVDEFVSAYVAPPTLEALFDGWSTPVMRKYAACYNSAFEGELVLEFIETGDVSHEQVSGYRKEVAEQKAFEASLN